MLMDLIGVIIIMMIMLDSVVLNVNIVVLVFVFSVFT